MQVIFEFIKYGDLVKVSAVDVRTGIEVVVSAPKNLSKKEMQELGYKKLQYVLRKNGLEN